MMLSFVSNFYISDVSSAATEDTVVLKMVDNKNPKAWKISAEIVRDGKNIPANNTTEQVKIVVGRMDNYITKGKIEIATDQDGIAYLDLEQLYKEDKTAPKESYVVLLPLSINNKLLNGNSENLEEKMTEECFKQLKTQTTSSTSSSAGVTTSTTISKEKESGETSVSSSQKKENESSSTTSSSEAKDTTSTSSTSQAATTTQSSEKTTSVAPKAKRNFLPYILLILIALLTVGGVALFFWVKRRREQEQLELIELFYKEEVRRMRERREKRRKRRKKVPRNT